MPHGYELDTLNYEDFMAMTTHDLERCLVSVLANINECGKVGPQICADYAEYRTRERILMGQKSTIQSVLRTLRDLAR